MNLIYAPTLCPNSRCAGSSEPSLVFTNYIRVEFPHLEFKIFLENYFFQKRKYGENDIDTVDIIKPSAEYQEVMRVYRPGSRGGALGHVPPPPPPPVRPLVTLLLCKTRLTSKIKPIHAPQSPISALRPICNLFRMT